MPRNERFWTIAYIANVYTLYGTAALGWILGRFWWIFLFASAYLCLVITSYFFIASKSSVKQTLGQSLSLPAILLSAPLLRMLSRSATDVNRLLCTLSKHVVLKYREVGDGDHRFHSCMRCKQVFDCPGDCHFCKTGMALDHVEQGKSRPDEGSPDGPFS